MDLKKQSKNTTPSKKPKESETRNNVIAFKEIYHPELKTIHVRGKLQLYSIACQLIEKKHDVEVIEKNSLTMVHDFTDKITYNFLDLKSKEARVGSQSRAIVQCIRKCIVGRKKEIVEEESYKQHFFSAKHRVFEDDEVFYLFDIDNCYWRTALNEKYITQELYDKLLSPEFKFARNKALATLSSIIFRTRKDENGELKRITQEVSDLPLIYKNIRNKSYKVCHDIKEAIPKKDFLWYRTDEIAIREGSYEQVKKIIKSLPYTFKERKCRVLYRNLIACEDGIYFMEDGGLFNLYKETDLEKIKQTRENL
jgi:hypothetical protein